MTLDELDCEFSHVGAQEHPPDVNTNAIEEVAVDGVVEEEEQEVDPWLLEDQHEVGEIRTQLLPLVAIEDALASELSGGVSFPGGRIGAFVRTGWQALVTPNWSISDHRRGRRNYTSEVINLASKTLGAVVVAITALWKHRLVKRLVQNRKLILDESAPL